MTGAIDKYLDRALPIVLAVVVAGTALAMGGAVPALFVGFALLAVAAALALAFFVQRQRTGLWPPTVLALLGVFSFCQAIPLPITWAARLSPKAADIWSRSLLPMGETLTTASLSLDPSASLTESLKWGAYAATFYLAAIMGRRRGASTGLTIVFGSAVAIAVVSLAHAAAGASTVYGLYKPLHGYPPDQIGPFLNPNNLSGYLNLGALVGVGLLFARGRGASRVVNLLGLLVVIATSLRTGSRGGVGTLAIALVAFGLWAAFARGPRQAGQKALASVTVSLLLVAGACVAVLADQRFWTNLLSKDANKLKLAWLTMPVVEDYPVAGVGRGAFESVFFEYRPLSVGNTAYTHPENLPAQWVVEWGVPTAVLAAIALLVSLSPLRRGVFKSAMAAGTVFGAAALLLHNQVDLGLELGGVGVALAAALGSVWGSMKQPPNVRPSYRYVRQKLWFFRAALAVTLVGGFWALIVGIDNVADDRFKIKGSLEQLSSRSDERARSSFRSELRRMMLRHPADYYFPLAGAFEARMRRDNAIPWIQRALERGPNVGRTHVLLGEILLSRGLQSQGLLEIRLGVEYETMLATIGATVAVAHTQDAEQLMRTVPDGPNGAIMLDALGMSLPTDAGAVGERIDQEALVRNAALVGPRRRIVERQLTALKNDDPSCPDRPACLEAIRAHADALDVYAPNTTLSARARARALWLEGRTDEAARSLEAGCNPTGERLECLLLRVEIAATLKGSDQIDSAVDAYLSASCAVKAQCAEAYSVIGRYQAKAGNLQSAVNAFERAAREEPNTTRWLELAIAAEQAGMIELAAHARTQAKTK